MYSTHVTIFLAGPDGVIVRRHADEEFTDLEEAIDSFSVYEAQACADHTRDIADLLTVADTAQDLLAGTLGSRHPNAVMVAGYESLVVGLESMAAHMLSHRDGTASAVAAAREAV